MTSIREPLPRPLPAMPPDPWVHRFGRTERFAHWWTVATLSAAVLSGLAMGDDGGSGGLFVVHVGSVALFGGGLIAAAVFGNHRALFGAAARLFSVGRADIAWVRDRARRPFGPQPEVRWGMFNTGQKLLAWSVTTSLLTVIGTGIADWNAGGEGGGLHGAMVAVTAVLVGSHVFMAVLNPTTRPALRGMVSGHVRRSWAARHHRAWLDELDP
jgi:formate dehydrogenase subunit gamma